MAFEKHGVAAAGALEELHRRVPIAQEQGLNLEVNSWQGLFLPQGTPQPIVRRLTQAIGETLDTRSVRDCQSKTPVWPGTGAL
jgi:tripartite-type tricarboxylate transporter receptor subunit TctC